MPEFRSDHQDILTIKSSTYPQIESKVVWLKLNVLKEISLAAQCRACGGTRVLGRNEKFVD